MNKVFVINTTDIDYTRCYVIQYAIKNENQYVETKDGIIIDNVTFKIEYSKKPKTYSLESFLKKENDSIEEFCKNSRGIKHQKIVNDKYSFNLKKESIQTKKKIKMRTYYDQRRKYR